MKKIRAKTISALLLSLFFLSLCTAGFASFTTNPYATIDKSTCGGVEYTALSYTVPNSVSTLESITTSWGFISTVSYSFDAFMEKNGAFLYSEASGSSQSIISNVNTVTINESLNVGVNTFVLKLTANGVTASSTLRITRLPLESPRAKSSASFDEAPPPPAFQELMALSAGPVFVSPDENSAQLGTVAAGETVSLLEWTGGETWCRVLYSGGNSAGWLHRKHLLGH